MLSDWPPIPGFAGTIGAGGGGRALGSMAAGSPPSPNWAGRTPESDRPLAGCDEGGDGEPVSEGTFPSYRPDDMSVRVDFSGRADFAGCVESAAERRDGDVAESWAKLGAAVVSPARAIDTSGFQFMAALPAMTPCRFLGMQRSDGRITPLSYTSSTEEKAIVGRKRMIKKF